MHESSQPFRSIEVVDQPPGSHHFKPLDGVRGLAVLMVIFTHAYAHPGNDLPSRFLTFVASFGWTGVTLFFSLSGLLIGGILMDAVGKPGWYLGFFARRALRILPLYFGFLLAYVLLRGASHAAAQQLPMPTGAGGVSYWFFLANMRQTLFHSFDSSGGLAPLWSVAVEEQFYLLFPLLIVFCPRRYLGIALIALIGCSAIWKMTMGATRQLLELRYTWMPACLDALAGGALVAWMSRDARWRLSLKKFAVGAGACAGVVVVALAIRDRTFDLWLEPLMLLSLGSFSFAIFFSAVIAYVVTSDGKNRFNRILSARWLRWCGKYSYAAYVFHHSIINLLRPVFGPWAIPAGYSTIWQATIFTLVVVLLTFAAARLSWSLFEKHFLALKRYFPAHSRVVYGNHVMHT